MKCRKCDEKAAIHMRQHKLPLCKEHFLDWIPEQTQRFRFFQLIKNITHDMLIRYTQIDYDREIAIIAEVQEEGRKKMEKRNVP